MSLSLLRTRANQSLHNTHMYEVKYVCDRSDCEPPLNPNVPRPAAAQIERAARAAARSFLSRNNDSTPRKLSTPLQVQESAPSAWSATSAKSQLLLYKKSDLISRAGKKTANSVQSRLGGSPRSPRFGLRAFLDLHLLSCAIFDINPLRTVCHHTDTISAAAAPEPAAAAARSAPEAAAAAANATRTAAFDHRKR